MSEQHCKNSENAKYFIEAKQEIKQQKIKQCK